MITPGQLRFIVDAVGLPLKGDPAALANDIEMVDFVIDTRAAVADLDEREAPKEVKRLMGETLPAIYTRHFGVEAGFSRTNGTASGPCIRFVSACLRTLGLRPYSDNSIANAIDAYRLKGRSSRTPKTRPGKRPPAATIDPAEHLMHQILQVEDADARRIIAAAHGVVPNDG